jgi:serine/threonine protein kinase
MNRFFYVPQVDSWAVGVLTYELLVGCAPFDDESREQVCMSILDLEPVYDDWMPQGAKSFIQAALTKVNTRNAANFALMLSLYRP